MSFSCSKNLIWSTKDPLVFLSSFILSCILPHCLTSAPSSASSRGGCPVWKWQSIKEAKMPTPTGKWNWIRMRTEFGKQTQKQTGAQHALLELT